MDKIGTLSAPVILVVEQFREMEQMIRSGILSCSSQLEFCRGSHDEILYRMSQHTPDLLIAPLMFEDSNAADLIRSLKARNTLVPALFLSDPESHDIQTQLLRLGAFEFLPKPFAMEDLLQRVNEVVKPKPNHHVSPLEKFVNESLDPKKVTAA